MVKMRLNKNSKGVKFPRNSHSFEYKGDISLMESLGDSLEIRLDSPIHIFGNVKVSGDIRSLNGIIVHGNLECSNLYSFGVIQCTGNLVVKGTIFSLYSIHVKKKISAHTITTTGEVVGSEIEAPTIHAEMGSISGVIYEEIGS